MKPMNSCLLFKILQQLLDNHGPQFKLKGAPHEAKPLVLAGS